MAIEEVAQAHYQAQQTLVRATVEDGQALWAGVRAAAVLESWLAVLDAVIRALTLGQLSVARLAQAYVNAAARGQGVTPDPAWRINPAAFSGAGADGRPLESLLMQPALRTLGLLAAGADDEDALRSGLASLTRILATETADAGRTAVGAGIVASKSFVMYVRKVNLPACGRCIILAGRTYAWSEGFERHENCDCVHVPMVYTPGQGYDQPTPASPKELFAQMTLAEQNKAFTNAGAEAIRDGADPGQVINARLGMTTAGGRSYTTAGTTVRGIAGKKLGDYTRAKGERYRRSKVPRPTTEQIYKDAAGDRDAAIALLKRFSYIL
ncbi:MAG TPA: hypothetical protein VIP77_21785 [Jiangellaceae bacterium]